MLGRSREADTRPGSTGRRPDEQREWSDGTSTLTGHDERTLDAIRRQLDAEFGGTEHRGRRGGEPFRARRRRSDRAKWARAVVGGLLVGGAVAVSTGVLATALYLNKAGRDVPLRPDVPLSRSELAGSGGSAAPPKLTTPSGSAPSRDTEAAPSSRAGALPRTPSRRANAALNEQVPPRLPRRPARPSWQITHSPPRESPRPGQSP